MPFSLHRFCRLFRVVPPALPIHPCRAFHRCRRQVPGFRRAGAALLLGFSFLACSSASRAQETPVPPAAAQLINLSVRSELPANEPLIAGFVIRGAAPVPLLVRAAGPGLRQLGLSAVMPDPNLKVFDARGAVVATNENWTPAHNSVDLYTLAVGAFPFRVDSLDAAEVVMLTPGAYTLHITGASATDAGTVLGEIYGAQQDLAAAGAQLVNLSIRGRLDGVIGLIGGFVVTGPEPRHFLIRAAGPALAPFLVPNVLENPRLEIADARGAVVRANDDWEEGEAAAEVTEAAARAGAFPFAPGSRDAAAVVTLQPGNYTVRVTGPDSAGRTALLEVYELQP